MRRALFSGALFLVAAVPAASSVGAPVTGQFQVTGAVSQSTSLLSVNDADQLLAGQIPASLVKTGTSPVVNFDDPQNPGAGYHFANKSPFVIDTAGNDTDFAIRATAQVDIPAAGEYTFGVNSDDGFDLKVGSFESAHADLRAPHDTLAVFDFAKPGVYPLELTYFQHLNHAEVELYASPGAYSGFHAQGANFELVGDTANGGLALGTPVSAPKVGTPPPTPEPSVLALVSVGLGLIARRRRRD